MDITSDLGGIMKLSIKTTKIVNESIKLFMNNLGSVRKKKNVYVHLFCIRVKLKLKFRLQLLN